MISFLLIVLACSGSAFATWRAYEHGHKLGHDAGYQLGFDRGVAAGDETQYRRGYVNSFRMLAERIDNAINCAADDHDISPFDDDDDSEDADADDDAE